MAAEDSLRQDERWVELAFATTGTARRAGVMIPPPLTLAGGSRRSVFLPPLAGASLAARFEDGRSDRDATLLDDR